MTIQALASDCIADMEWATPCEVIDCGTEAEWSVWMSHAPVGDCTPACANLCDPCKSDMEGKTILCLSGVPLHCPTCGQDYNLTGQLSDHFRAIKL